MYCWVLVIAAISSLSFVEALVGRPLLFQFINPSAVSLSHRCSLLVCFVFYFLFVPRGDEYHGNTVVWWGKKGVEVRRALIGWAALPLFPWRDYLCHRGVTYCIPQSSLDVHFPELVFSLNGLSRWLLYRHSRRRAQSVALPRMRHSASRSDLWIDVDHGLQACSSAADLPFEWRDIVSW